MLGVVAGHALILGSPASVPAWNGSPARLVAVEVTLFAAGCAAMTGFIALAVRGMPGARRGLASIADSILLSLLTPAMFRDC
jgi:hypothetical protein